MVGRGLFRHYCITRYSPRVFPPLPRFHFKFSIAICKVFYSGMSFQPEVVDGEHAVKVCEMIAYIEELVARNLPDEMTQSTMDPMYNEFASKGVVELGYRDTRHFCESFPLKFQVTDVGGDMYVIALRSAVPRVRPSYMINSEPIAVRLACDCFVHPSEINTHVCACPNCNMKGHRDYECPSPRRSN
ncbi:hypothetical protein PRIPAC_72224 [Pristionchus pacificus]|uniref:Uncharacterized protein n=1 Tax=Pristionchus pacificus TaxID=54126 RepID=A0A8R1Z748_PRIPA|nr:hypothetical protein PRIPAC_72224 [Pristionchus pacificus]